MHNITFDLPTLHCHGSAFFDYLKLRKRFFVDQLKWDIPHNDNHEMDQYDNPMAYYSLVVDEGVVLGGARVMATSTVWGKHTSMMGDAHDGKLEHIPNSVGAAKVASPEVWEMTRLVISDELTNISDRRTCLQMVCDGVIETARMNGCVELLGLSSLPLLRVLRQVGYQVDRVGQPYRDANDGRQYTAMRMGVAPIQHMIAAE